MKNNNNLKVKTLKTHLGITSTDYIAISKNSHVTIQSEIVDESHSCLTINGKDVAEFMCSPRELNYLAAGFLFNEKIINKAADIQSIHISKNNCIDVWINKRFEMPSHKIITAGCGGGVTFDDLSEQHEPLISNISISLAKLSDLMKKVHLGAELYSRARGIHTAAITDTKNILLQVEDIGRHNCLDKLAGFALLEEIKTKDRILFSSGRISSEMINKSRRMGIPIVCSRTSPTSLSIKLAQEWNITLIGYLRQNRMRIYNAPERVLDLREVKIG